MTRYSLLCFLFLSLLGCSSIISTPKFTGSIFLHDQIPQELCTKEIEKFGIYRRLYNGETEFLSYCHNSIKLFVAAHEREVDIVRED